MFSIVPAKLPSLLYSSAYAREGGVVSGLALPYLAVVYRVFEHTSLISSSVLRATS